MNASLLNDGEAYMKGERKYTIVPPEVKASVLNFSSSKTKSRNGGNGTLILNIEVQRSAGIKNKHRRHITAADEIKS
jgi:hypothetical protein